MHPLQYGADCEAILGYTLPHDDSVNDRSDGSKLNNAHEITVRLWNEAFSKSFAKPGAMFRGDPPNGKLWPIKQEHLTQMLSFSRFNVRIARLEIRLAPSPIIETNDYLFLRQFPDIIWARISAFFGEAKKCRLRGPNCIGETDAENM